jgi:hypothetical protein
MAYLEVDYDDDDDREYLSLLYKIIFNTATFEPD